MIAVAHLALEKNYVKEAEKVRQALETVKKEKESQCNHAEKTLQLAANFHIKALTGNLLS